jgi:hypothetical protein
VCSRAPRSTRPSGPPLWGLNLPEFAENSISTRGWIVWWGYSVYLGPFGSQADGDVFRPNSPLPLFFANTMASASAWVSLPPKWKLQDVQAALNVVIAVLSTLGVFAFARFCWLSNAPNITRDQTIPLSSLMTINTLGQAFDILFLLRSRIFHRRYWKILAQSIVVLCLSTTALLSGPIARYSTQHNYVIVPKRTMGLLANRIENNILNAILQWNATIASLDQAGFPYDQLLDYLPDTLVPWIYKPEEWNNSWTMDCKYTYSTPITLYDTGNCSDIYSEIPGLNDIVPPSKYGSNIWVDATSVAYAKRPITQDALVAVAGTQYNDVDNATNITYGMTIALALVHLHELPEQMNNSSPCYFGAGNVTSASYTKIECYLRRLVHDPNIFYIAYPDSFTPGNVIGNGLQESNIANGLIDFPEAQFIQEAVSNSTITIPTPQDLVRFYQAYTISKDTKYHDPVPRTLSVRVQIVQLSAIFLGITVLLAILVLFGILTYGFSMLRYSGTLSEMPQSTLDWILQSIQARHPQSGDRIPSDKAFWRYSVTSSATDASIYASSKSAWKRAEFENARYGAVQFPEQDLGEGWLQQRHGRAEYRSDAATVPYVQGPVPHVIPRKPVGSIGATEVPMLMMDFPENQKSLLLGIE